MRPIWVSWCRKDRGLTLSPGRGGPGVSGSRVVESSPLKAYRRDMRTAGSRPCLLRASFLKELFCFEGWMIKSLLHTFALLFQEIRQGLLWWWFQKDLIFFPPILGDTNSIEFKYYCSSGLKRTIAATLGPQNHEKWRFYTSFTYYPSIFLRDLRHPDPKHQRHSRLSENIGRPFLKGRSWKHPTASHGPCGGGGINQDDSWIPDLIIQWFSTKITGAPCGKWR